MVPLIRPYFLGGWHRGVPLDSHNDIGGLQTKPPVDSRHYLQELMQGAVGKKPSRLAKTEPFIKCNTCHLEAAKRHDMNIEGNDNKTLGFDDVT